MFAEAVLIMYALIRYISIHSSVQGNALRTIGYRFDRNRRHQLLAIYVAIMNKPI